MTDSVFFDTNGWLALLNSAERLHEDASRKWESVVIAKRRLVLSDWIIAETGNGLARFQQKRNLSKSLKRLLESPRTELVIVDAALIDRALDFFAQHADKSWGLVDCASFLIMSDRSIATAFTSDQHFEQAGFTRLLNT